MPWRTLDNYAIRRRQELHERRKAEQLPQRPAFQRSARARTEAAQQATSLRARNAREILRRMRKRRDPLPGPGSRPDSWTLEQDTALLHAIAASVPLSQLGAHMTEIRPQATNAACGVRWSKLLRLWGLR